MMQKHPRRAALLAVGCLVSTLLGAPVAQASLGAWESTSAMSQARDNHTATRLPDGRVLVAGGEDASGVPTTTAEIYNPTTKSWSATGSMVVPRASHTATLLTGTGCGTRCGLVLVVGGYSASSANTDNSSNSAELYDPASGLWLPTGPMIDLRSNHTATLLPNGKVLVAGGLVADASSFGQRAAIATDTAELYDPATNLWSETGTLLTRARAFHTATLLQNGNVLLAGRIEPNGATAELYKPAQNAFTATAPMATGRSQHDATLLPDGKVLVAGGLGGGNSAELYDPDAGTWSTTGSMLAERADHTATLLGNGEVLVAGGSFGSRLAAAELYDPASASWSATGAMGSARSNHTATLLEDGRVLAAGGPAASAEIYGLVVDTQAPETTITSGPDGVIGNNAPTFEFTSDEAESTFECRVDGADSDFAPCTSPHSTQALVDGSHTFFVRATDAAANTDPTPASRSFTVQTEVEPEPGLVSVGDVSVYEGDSGDRKAIFTVSLSTPSTSTVTVDYATSGGTADAGDFTAKSGTLSFAPGVTSLPLKVTVLGEKTDEPDETFTLGLSSPSSGTAIADGSGVGTIVDDDPAAVGGLRLAIGDVSVHEGDAGSRLAVFNVSLSKPTSSNVYVSFATKDGTAIATDFTSRSGRLTFTPGATTLNVKVHITPDTVAEGPESFYVKLTDASGAAITRAKGVATIIDNE